MKHFTAEEARKIIEQSSPAPILDPSHPDHEAVSVLLEETSISMMGPRMAAIMGVALGKAIGIREERNSRKGTTPAPECPHIDLHELDGMNLEMIRTLNIGEYEMMTDDMVELIRYGNQFGSDSWFYMVTTAYNLGFKRGQEAPHGSIKAFRLPLLHLSAH